jgi:phosphohistidine phosphatase
MTIYLSQHGKAKEKTEDPERHLSMEGISESERVLKFIKKCSIEVDSVIHSGKARAEETGGIFLKEVKSKNGLVQKNGLNPNDNAEDIYEFILQEKLDFMFVGHLPFMNRLCSIMICGNENMNTVRFKNSCIVCLSKEDTEDFFTLNWAVNPEII